jgi:hypothetical protein
MVANTLDSNSQGGQQGSPTPDNLTSQNVQPPSTPAPTSSPEQMRTLVAELIGEALRDPKVYTSIKDKRISGIEQQLRDASPVLEQVRKILTPEQQAQFSQIQRDAEFEQLKQAVYGNSSTQTGTPQSGTPGSAALDVEPILSSLQFQPNDPALAALKIKHSGNTQELLKAAADLRLTQLQSPNPSPATAMNGPSGTSPASGGLTPQQVEQKSIELQRMYDNYSANEPKIKALESELNTYWATQK